MVTDPENNHDVWGDLLCGACGLVLHTLTVPTEGEYDFVKVGELGESRVRARVLIYCDVCEKTTSLVISPMASDPMNNNKVSGNFLCGECGSVLATLTVAEQGEYAFVEVRDHVRFI
jgi:hypothetical protein